MFALTQRTGGRASAAPSGPHRRPGAGRHAARGAAWIAGAAPWRCWPAAAPAPRRLGRPRSAPSASPSATVLAGGSCKSSSATKITFWAWVPGFGRAVNEFNKTHSGICVTLEDVGAGSPEYVKISDALKAGSGAPDVAEVEFDELPSFEITHNVLNLAKYGAEPVQERLRAVGLAGGQPGFRGLRDAERLRPDGLLLQRQGTGQVPHRPAGHLGTVRGRRGKLHKADSSAYLTNFAGTDLQWIISLMSQDNAFPFTYSGGAKVGINWTGPAQLKFAAYWQKMLSAHELNAVTDMAATAFADMDKGIDASWLSSAWGPSYFAPDAKSSVGQWKAAELPQWSAGADVAANWGGSTYPVFSQSAHPQQAAEFAEWLTANSASWNIVKTPPSSLFPTYVPLLNSSSFKDLTYPISGSATPNVAFTAAAPKIATVQWPPFMTYALTESATTFAGVMNGKETLAQAFKTFQGQLVSYAKAQGFTVTS